MDDNLSKWLNGELTDDQLIEKLGPEEATKYIQIVSEVDNWVPEKNTQSADPTIITNKPKGIQRTMKSWYMYAAAAMLVLTSGYFWLQFSSSSLEYITQAGEMKVITLPDGVSTVTLAPSSKLSLDEDEWEEAVALKENRLRSYKARRRVRLKGKALFKVEKGTKFKVESSSGEVEVLGTIFEVDDFEEGLNVACFEGEVLAKPKRGKRSVTIKRGESYLFYKGKWEEKVNIRGDGPSWLQNQTKFENAPLSQVISALEKLYGIDIETGDVDVTRRFTGTKPNDKSEVALRIVFSPFGISFSQEGDLVILAGGN